VSAVSLSVIIPAYREEENLRLLLPRVVRELEATGRTFELLVIDTPTPVDATAQVCRELGATPVRRGPTDCYGDAVRTGLATASGEWILFMDGDGSHAPELIPRLLERTQVADVVLGSRYVEGGHTENPWLLRAMSRIVNLCYTVVLGLPVRDVSNSFKLYRAAMVRDLPLRCRDFDVIEELLFKLRRRHPEARLVEVPVAFRKRMFGETKRNLVTFMLSFAVTLVRLRLSVWRDGPARPGGEGR
jgi:dolichol-phosphate mannosyltransferase